MAEIVLTKEQQAVVDDRGGTLLVSAAAGSGKTKVLIDRVLALVEEKHCDLDRFLMITFTQAAAAELRGKLLSRLSEQLAMHPDDRHLQRQMSRVYLTQISTVHAFCGTVLREYAHLIDLPADFRVCDEQEAAILRERVMQATLESAYEHLKDSDEVTAALDMLGAGRNDDSLPKLIEKLYFSVQSYCNAEERMEKLRKDLDFSSVTDIGETIWGEYLISQLHAYLDGCIKTLTEASALSQGALEKYYSTMQDNLAMLQSLRGKTKWDEISRFPLDFGKLAPITKCTEPELKDRVQAMRKRVISGVKSRVSKFNVPSEEALRDLSVNAKALHGLILLTERFAAAYFAEKRRRHVLDYNDLEHEMLRLVLTSSAAKELAGRYEQIMVDEYQDTNEVQDTIFRAISRDGENLFFVGDVKQSIYGFRRADPTIFLEKYKTFADYTDAVPGEPRKIILSDNFRSHPAVLEAANDVFRLTMTEHVGGLRYGDSEALRPKRAMPEMQTNPVELHCISMEKTTQPRPVSKTEIEAEFVARRIREMLDYGETVPDGDTLRPIIEGDIVILMRSLTDSADVYKNALARYAINCVCGNDNIFETEEVTLLLALLQVIDNPHQDIPLLTVLLSPLFCCTANELAFARSKNRGGDIYDTIKGTSYCRVVDELRTAAQTASLRGLLDITDDRLFIRTVYGAMENGTQRVQNINRFFALADSYESGERYGLPGFLRYLEALRTKGVSADSLPVNGAVRIMSVHKSKGLEFPVAFLCGLGKKFNFTDASASVLINSTLGIASNVYDPAQQLVYPTVAKSAIADRIRKETMSEEMRVLYVAMTRAQYRLVMTCCKSHLTKKLSDIARDLTIPADDSLIETAESLSDWILMTAMTHTEAGALFAEGGYPQERWVSEHPWKIELHQSSDYMTENSQTVTALETAEKTEYMPLDYPYEKAVSAPSKVTATQLKGRVLDEEISEDAQIPDLTVTVRKPHFAYGKRSLTGAERGTAIHLAMQYVRYENCTDTESIRKELDRLVEMRFLTAQQREAVPEEKILNFFASETGKRVLSAERVIREYKFSVLEDGSLLDPALAGEKLLLQGVTDCCIVENGEMTILDFKSDHIQPGQEAERAAYYRSQLDAYSIALSKVLDLPVKERILYFFSTDCAINA